MYNPYTSPESWSQAVVKRRPARFLRFLLPGLGLTGFVAAGVGLLLQDRPGREPGSMAEFLRILEKPDPHSLELARSFAASHRAEVSARLRGLLNHPNGQVRVNACVLAADQRDAAALAAVFPHAGDRDYFVRARAFGALSRFYPVSFPFPQRNTPLDQRERDLLVWLEEYDSLRGHSLGEQLCELYAGTDQLEFGTPLSTRCLTCHAGVPSVAFDAADACRSCHEEIHRDWSGSAHANSLSHLHLMTVDARTRQSRWMEFGAVRGIGCTECHRPAALPARALQTQPADDRCAYEFVSSPAAAESCARCHREIHRQWRQWTSMSHPRRLEWPPGGIDSVDADTRTCVDCHMPTAPDGRRGLRDHRWSARRHPDLLREGLDVRIAAPGPEEESWRLILTNLAGHAYPGGTCRRAVEIHLQIDRGDGWQRALVLGSPCPGESAGTREPALQAGQQRVVPLKIPATATRIGYRVVYVRDWSNPDLYTIDICAGQWDIP